MYLMQNIIQKAIDQKKDKLSVLILNEDNEEYIYNLSKLDHNFYIIQENGFTFNWRHNFIPNNLIFVNNFRDFGIKEIDCIIVFDRINTYEKASLISKQYHIPIIVVDIASSLLKSKVPFFINAKIDNPNITYLRNGNVSVGISNFVTDSWHSYKQYFGTTIIPITEPIISKSKEKILIDMWLAKDYIDNLPIKINSDNYTTNPENAIVYLHLWKNINPLMFQCMASEIPVITFNSEEFNEIIEEEACILLEDINVLNKPNFIEFILDFANEKNIIANAKNFINKRINEENNFTKSWNNLLSYVSNMHYLRGIYD